VNHNPPDYDYEPAPVEESLAGARAILANLYELPLLPVIGEGTCQDCVREQTVLKYGRIQVCRPCAHLRQRAGVKAAA
jgi:hypothetical protein